MSIKIYYGYRFKKKYLSEFTTEVRDLHYQFVLNLVRERAMKVKPDRNGERLTWHQKVHSVLQAAVEAAKSSVRTPWDDIECSWGIWCPPKSAYCLTVPYGDNSVHGDQLKLPEWVESYSYWNNTDRPISVNPREWSRRKKAWRFYTQDGGQNYQMELPVISLREGIASYHHASLTVDLDRLGEPSAIEMLGAQAGD